jgi:hypothetical protein
VIAVMTLLAGGGTAAGLTMTATPANAAQAVALNAALTAPVHGCPAGAGAQGSGAQGSGAQGSGAQGSGAQGTGGRAKGCLGQQVHQVKGMYGEVAFHSANGTQTLAFERGAIISVNGNQLTVRAANGTQWSWNLASDSVIRNHGASIPAVGLVGGMRVFVGGQVDGSSRDARLVLVHLAKKHVGRHGRHAGRHGRRPSGKRSPGRSASGAGSSGGSTSKAGS